MDGKGIVGLSLPVRIFEARSSIERICDLFLYSNHYLARAAATDEPEERIKYVLGWIAAALPHAISQYKPFNPLLGETFQATLADGTTIDCEHTSHHPPISNYYITNPHYKIYGSLTINGEIHANSINAFIETVTHALKMTYRRRLVLHQTAAMAITLICVYVMNAAPDSNLWWLLSLTSGNVQSVSGGLAGMFILLGGVLLSFQLRHRAWLTRAGGAELRARAAKLGHLKLLPASLHIVGAALIVALLLIAVMNRF